jgi:hypothetical protein
MDFRDFAGSAAPQIDRRWWTLGRREAADSITATLQTLQRAQSDRLRQQVTSTRLYGNVSPSGIAGLQLGKVAAVQPGVRDRITYNVVQSVIDTVTAKIAKNRPKPLFLTSGGDYQQQRKAKRLNQFCDGLFYEAQTYRLAVEAFRDACVVGDGVIHVFERDGRVCHERVMSSEMWVDELEGFYGHPRQMHRAKAVDRQVLADAFPGHRSAIEKADRSTVDQSSSRPSMSDLVQVRESWHLPSSKSAKDGLHVISIDGECLLVEEWTRDYFPFARLTWTPRMWGFWGQGLAEQIQNLQLEINKLLWVIQRSMHLAGSYKVLVENSSKIVSEHLNNDIGAIIKYAGTAPQYVAPPIIPQEIYAHLETLKRAAFEQAGVSQLSAEAKKPSGLDSGAALREYNDIESDRFATIGKAYEQFFLDVARMSVDEARGIYAESGSYSVKSPAKKWLETVDWADIDLAEDAYVMQVYPVSSLPTDPAGRLQTVQEYAQAGFLDPKQAKRLLDFPDLEAANGLSNATEDYLAKILDAMVDRGEYEPPEPFDDLPRAREMALEYYQRGKAQGLEEERLEMLRRFLSQLDMLDQIAIPQMPAGGAAPGVPEAPPVSDLMPAAPGAAPVA